jgi:FKBP-type peptidyl-prolyl cis-trans isomerase FklB
MRQAVGAETIWKNRSHTRSGLVRFFQTVYAQKIDADRPFLFRILGLNITENSRMKRPLAFAFAAGLLASAACAQDQLPLTNALQTNSYALGASIAAKLRRQDADLDLPALAAGLAAMQAGQPALTPAEEKAALKDLKADLAARAAAKRKIEGDRNLRLGQAFLAANALKPGVQVIHVTAPDGAPAEVQYQVLASGGGPRPKTNDILRLHYEGRLIDGTVFDSSLRRGRPFTGRADDFIAGWTEPLRRMRVGDQWRLFVPPSLGYGEFVPYNIGSESTLIYDIQLLGIVTPAAAAK